MLYHGSKNPGIKVLKLSKSSVVGYESVVFASPDIRFALAMIHGTDRDIGVGYVGDDSTGKYDMYIEEITPNAFDLLKAPGYLYTVLDDGFAGDQRICRVELVSKNEVAVQDEKYIENVWDELQKYDITFRILD